ncbi:hypothetical protein [Halomonas sp. NO4]|uniref:hypothetical protein n=1 Tax=Halomonas sp. NO4 TaxID=2484813 RepID=UPI0013D0EC6C|nr:hypothetical protein [Halomonas sp. NO4]
MLKPLLVGLLALWVLAGCAAPAEHAAPLRQALLGLGDRAAEQVREVDALQPFEQQVLLLAAPEVDAALGLGAERVRESLTRALLAVSPGPQVIDWRSGMDGEAGPHQWRLASRLEATGPRLALSDRELLPYRLTLTLQRPGGGEAVWQTRLEGAFDATAL